MRNLSFLKGLFVGIAIATIGAVAYANSVSSAAQGIFSWVQIEDRGVYFCVAAPATTGIALGGGYKFNPTCTTASLIENPESVGDWNIFLKLLNPDSGIGEIKITK
jgi:hypothetical protein